MSVGKATLEHVAFWVRDIHWHIEFFREVCGMTMREAEGPLDAPAQYWTLGGLQFISKPDFAGPEGRMAHLGVMCEDAAATIAAARRYGVSDMPQGDNWVRLPDGLVVEFLQANPKASVATARELKWRGET